jgi:hypothetical protein
LGLDGEKVFSPEKVVTRKTRRRLPLSSNHGSGRRGDLLLTVLYFPFRAVRRNSEVNSGFCLHWPAKHCVDTIVNRAPGFFGLDLTAIDSWVELALYAAGILHLFFS